MIAPTMNVWRAHDLAQQLAAKLGPVALGGDGAGGLDGDVDDAHSAALVADPGIQ